MNTLGLGDITALVTAIGVLVGTLAASAVKLGQCINGLRRQTARVQHTTTQTRREVHTETGDIKSQVERIEAGLDRIQDAVFERANITDQRINHLSTRIKEVEDGLRAGGRK